MSEKMTFERWISESWGAYLSTSEEALARTAWLASRNQALEEAAAICDGLSDPEKEAHALRESKRAEGTPEELGRLKFWSMVSTFNAGLRRAASAIRREKEDV